jgi:VanZ family protein
MTMEVLRRIDPWAPPLALMALIFFFSAQADLNSGLGLIDQVGRKVIHAGEYAVLAFLWWRALRTVMPPDRALVAALAIAVAYSATDEFHQTFVRGRHGSPVDVLIDSLGALLAALLIHRSRTAARTQ